MLASSTSFARGDAGEPLRLKGWKRLLTLYFERFPKQLACILKVCTFRRFGMLTCTRPLSSESCNLGLWGQPSGSTASCLLLMCSSAYVGRPEGTWINLNAVEEKSLGLTSRGWQYSLRLSVAAWERLSREVGLCPHSPVPGSQAEQSPLPSCPATSRCPAISKPQA